MILGHNDSSVTLAEILASSGRSSRGGAAAGPQLQQPATQRGGARVRPHPLVPDNEGQQVPVVCYPKPLLFPWNGFGLWSCREGKSGCPDVFQAPQGAREGSWAPRWAKVMPHGGG